MPVPAGSGVQQHAGFLVGASRNRGSSGKPELYRFLQHGPHRATQLPVVVAHHGYQPRGGGVGQSHRKEPQRRSIAPSLAKPRPTSCRGSRNPLSQLVREHRNGVFNQQRFTDFRNGSRHHRSLLGFTSGIEMTWWLTSSQPVFVILRLNTLLSRVLWLGKRARQKDLARSLGR